MGKGAYRSLSGPVSGPEQLIPPRGWEMPDSSNGWRSWLISLFLKNASRLDSTRQNLAVIFLILLQPFLPPHPPTVYPFALLSSASFLGSVSSRGHPPPPLLAPLANERSKTLQWLMSSRLWDLSVNPPPVPPPHSRPALPVPCIISSANLTQHYLVHCRENNIVCLCWAA